MDCKRGRYKYEVGENIYRFRKREHYIKILEHIIIEREVKNTVRNEKGINTNV